MNSACPKRTTRTISLTTSIQNQSALSFQFRYYKFLQLKWSEVASPQTLTNYIFNIYYTNLVFLQARIQTLATCSPAASLCTYSYTYTRFRSTSFESSDLSQFQLLLSGVWQRFKAISCLLEKCYFTKDLFPRGCLFFARLHFSYDMKCGENQKPVFSRGRPIDR